MSRVVGGRAKAPPSRIPPSGVSQTVRQVPHGQSGQSVTTRVPPVRRSANATDYRTSSAISAAERKTALVRRREVEESLQRGIIVQSTVRLYNSEEVTRVANGIVIQPDVVEQDKNGTSSAIGSMNDPRMGVVNLSSQCPTCGEINCPGHFAELHLGCKIINPQFVSECISLLRILCHCCSVPKITAFEINKLGLLSFPLKKQLREIAEVCVKHHCISAKEKPVHGNYSPCTRNPILSSESLVDYGVIKYSPDNGKGKPSGPFKQMSIDEIYRILNGMSLESCKMLGFGTQPTVIPPGTANPKIYAPFLSHPRDIIQDKLVIPPNIARPAVREGNTEAPDLMTHKLNSICEATRGEVSRKGKSKARSSDGTVRATEVYKRIRSLYFPIQDDKVRGREFQPMVARIQGKEAIIRKNAMGKQNIYCARAVAGCNPGADYEWIGIPERSRKTLTTSVTVNERNREAIVRLMRQGEVLSINPYDRDTTITWSPGLRIVPRYGDTINRFAQHGDWIMCNRQPSLHGTSMMAFRMYFHPGDTILNHLSISTPFNLDHDGDEINLWKPQSPETVQECIELLACGRNIMSVEKSMPVMGMVMNSVTAFYQLCRLGDSEVSEVLYKEIVDLMTYRHDLSSLPERLARYGVKPMSGAGIVSMLFPPDFYYDSGDVHIMEGVLISGRLNKDNVGTSRNSIIQIMHKLYGHERTTKFFTDAPYIMNKFIMEDGFSIGMKDCISIGLTEDGVPYDKNREEMKRENSRITAMVKGMGGPLSDPVAEGIRLRNIKKQTDAAKAIGQKLANEMLTEDNAFAIQSELHAKTKGNTGNIGAVMGCVGQQYYRGERLAATLTGGTRTLPSFDIGDNSPQAHGYIGSSYISGVTPAEFYFLMMGSREGQLDTANEVQKTGTIQHRMIKAGENTLIDADNSLRNNSGVMFNPLYNNGFNPAATVPAKLRGRDILVPFNLSYMISRLNAQRGWTTPKVAAIIEKRLGPVTDLYIPQTRSPSIPEPVKGITHRGICDYEKARLLSTRAMALDKGSVPLVEVSGPFDPHAIAEAEYQAGVIPQFVIRKYADGSYIKLHPDPEFFSRIGLQ
jgi:DNA-directed RNA polymerase beta' subunit/DNA-directed RNA polymerase subunit K/omega